MVIYDFVCRSRQQHVFRSQSLIEDCAATICILTLITRDKNVMNRHPRAHMGFRAPAASVRLIFKNIKCRLDIVPGSMLSWMFPDPFPKHNKHPCTIPEKGYCIVPVTDFHLSVFIRFSFKKKKQTEKTERRSEER